MTKPKGFALNDKISLRQMQALLFLEIFGFGVTALPRRVAEAAAQDGWLGVVFAAVAALMMVWVIVSIAKKYNGEDFYGFVCKTLSTPVGVIICLFFSVRLLMLAAFNLRIFAEITQTMLLPTTPFFVVFATMLGLAAYGASKGIEARGRMAEILILIAIIPLVLVLALSGRELDFTNLLPVLTSSPRQLASSAHTAFFAFNGMDMLLLITPFIAKPKNAKNMKRSSLGIIATMGGAMVIITIVTIARFGPENIINHIWPVLKMMDTVTPGSVIDRQGALMMTFWIISAYAIINAALFFSSLLLKDVFKRGNHSNYILLCAPAIGILAYIPRNLAETYHFFDLYNRTVGLAAMIGVPILIWVASRRFKNAE